MQSEGSAGDQVPRPAFSETGSGDGVEPAQRGEHPEPTTPPGPGSTSSSPYYPDQLLPIAGEHPLLVPDRSPEQDLRERYDHFSEVREGILLDYRYNTARAYWGDLDDLFWWCERRRLDVHSLTERQFNQYVGLLRRRRYSENTVRRRRTSYAKWVATLAAR